MNTRFPFRTTLAGLALGVLLALLLAPQSRWLVRFQLAAAGLTRSTLFSAQMPDDALRQRLAAQHPQDFGVQMAAAQGEQKAAQFVSTLHALAPRFGTNPALYATLLRYEVQSDDSKQGVFLNRAEEGELGTDRRNDPPPPPAPALLAQFDADAARGEQIDPQNAFFPLMRAIGLFAAHRDAEGLAAVQRASTKPLWNEYLADEVDGRLRLADAVYGHAPSISRVAIAAGELFPQYAPLRAVARVAVVLAIHAELRGDKAQGMRIRRAVMTDGDLMRVQSTSYIGSLVGIAISGVARSRPGGTKALSRPAHTDPEEGPRARLDAFTSYARQAGFPGDADRAQAQYGAGKAVRRIVSKSFNHSISSPQRLNWLAAWWIVSLLALANAFWLLVLGLLCGLLSRLPSVRARQPLPPPVRWGITAAFALAIGIAAYAVNDSDTRPVAGAVMTLGIAGGLAVGALTLRRSGAAARQHLEVFGRAMGVTILVIAGAAGVAAWQTHGTLGFVAVEKELSGLSGNDEGEGSAPQAAIGLLVAGIGLLVPLVVAIGLSIRARKRRVPVSAALAAGFRGIGVPLACALVIGYGVTVLGTLREEQRINDGLRQMIRHEGRYYASLAGEVWPGPA